MPADDVPLSDLEVIPRFSLGFRSPVASRAELVAARRSAGAPLGAGSGAAPMHGWARRRPVRRSAPRSDT